MYCFMERKIGSRGLRQGDLLSPLLFILVNGYGGVELDVEKILGGYIHGFRVGNDAREGFYISHLLFVVDVILFCDANSDQVLYIRMMLTCFEVVKSLKFNSSKSEMVSIRRYW